MKKESDAKIQNLEEAIEDYQNFNRKFIMDDAARISTRKAANIRKLRENITLNNTSEI